MEMNREEEGRENVCSLVCKTFTKFVVSLFYKIFYKFDDIRCSCEISGERAR